MVVDLKGIANKIWRVIAMFMNRTYRFARNHPVFSGFGLFSIILYTFVPWVLYFLIYSSPILACIYVYSRNRLNSNPFEFRNFSRNQKKDSGKSFLESKHLTAVGNDASHLRHQRSVRRNAPRKVEEWESQTSEDEKDKVILTSLYNDLLGRTPHFEESPKPIETDIEKNEISSSVFYQKLCNSPAELISHPSRDSVSPDCVKPAGGGETEEEEEENGKGQEDRKCCEENDEKKIMMEPGISEMERNKRLESLMARRRARRLFKLAVNRNNMMAKEGDNLNILPISVARNNAFDLQNCSSGMYSSQMPSSAPSVLLRARNPFDIPYDPLEEKPNLTGDSFDQEFSLINPKDVIFCRNESICRGGPFPSDLIQAANKSASSSNIRKPTNDMGNGEENHQVELETAQKGEEAEKETDSGKTEKGSLESGNSTEEKVYDAEMDSDYSDKKDDNDLTSSEESEQEFNSLNQSELREAVRQTMGTIPVLLGGRVKNFLPSPIPRAVPPRIDDHHSFYASRGVNSHARTFSIASDLQVEVSEIGSPPTTVDGNDYSSSDGESYMYDTDIDREIAHCGEEYRRRTWRQYESNSSKGGGETEITVREESFSGIGKKPENPTPMSSSATQLTKQDLNASMLSSSSVEKAKKIEGDDKPKEHVENLGKVQVAELYHSDTSKPSSSVLETPDYIMDKDSKTEENVKLVTEKLMDHGPSSSTDAISSPSSENVEESQAPLEKPIEADLLDWKQMEDRDFGFETLDDASEDKQHLVGNLVIKPPDDKDMEIPEDPHLNGALTIIRGITEIPKLDKENAMSNVHETMEKENVDPAESSEELLEGIVSNSIDDLVIIEKSDLVINRAKDGENLPKLSIIQMDITHQSDREKGADSYQKFTEDEIMGVASMNKDVESVKDYGKQVKPKNGVETSKQAEAEYEPETSEEVLQDSNILEDSLVFSPLPTEVETDRSSTREADTEHILVISPRATTQFETYHSGNPDANLEHHLVINPPTTTEIKTDGSSTPEANTKHGLKSDLASTHKADIENNLATNAPATEGGTDHMVTLATDDVKE